MSFVYLRLVVQVFALLLPLQHDALVRAFVVIPNSDAIASVTIHGHNTNHRCLQRGLRIGRSNKIPQKQQLPMKVVSSSSLSRKTITKLYAAKLLYKWKVLPSGSISGIYKDDLITTSTIIGADLSQVSANSILTTSSGSQYKLMGESIGKNPFLTTTPLPPASLPTKSYFDDSTAMKNNDSLLMTNTSILVLTAISAILVYVLFQKSGSESSMLDLLANNDLSKLSWRAMGLILYMIGVIIGTIQLVSDANRLSK